MFAKKNKESEMPFHLPQHYGVLSHQDKKVVRLQYCKEQDGKCYHCGEHLDGPPSMEARRKKIHPELYPENFFDHPIHLHHNHNTDLTIGAVHCVCNAVLWEHHNE